MESDSCKYGCSDASDSRPSDRQMWAVKDYAYVHANSREEDSECFQGQNLKSQGVVLAGFLAA